MEEKKKIWKLRKLYRAYLTDDIKRDMYVNWADEKLIDLVEAEEVEEEDLYKFLNQISVLKKFIKWLVENDKIDTDAYKTVYSGDLDKRKTLTMSSGWDEFYQVTEHWVYESLLMLLSISSSPIDNLISYLK